MPTPRKSAPFGIHGTRGRSQPSRQPAIDVTIVHRIAELELELLNIIHDHYGLDLPTVIPLYTPILGPGTNPGKPKASGASPELSSYCEMPGQSVRKSASGQVS